MSEYAKRAKVFFGRGSVDCELTITMIEQFKKGVIKRAISIPMSDGSELIVMTDRITHIIVHPDKPLLRIDPAAMRTT